MKESSTSPMQKNPLQTSVVNGDMSNGFRCVYGVCVNMCVRVCVGVCMCLGVLCVWVMWVCVHACVGG